MERARKKPARIAAIHELEIAGVQSVTTTEDDNSEIPSIVDEALADAPESDPSS